MMKNFKKLTTKQQRIAIVKDAIMQIKLGKFIPVRDLYISVITQNLLSYDKGLKEILEENKCECCAKGALFAACVLNVNKVTLRDKYADQNFQKDKLKKWFTPLQLDMIETAFEGRVIYDSTGNLHHPLYGGNTTLADKCVDFGRSYNSSYDKLLAILNNIVKNGRFKP